MQIERVRLHPIKRVRFSDFKPLRKQRRPRGPNKTHLITDDRSIINRRELAAICGVSVDTIKKWEAKTPNDTGLQPIRLGPKGRTVFYNIDQAELYTGVPLRRRRAPEPASGAPAAPPSPSKQAA
jgi:hypothetical protein